MNNIYILIFTIISGTTLFAQAYELKIQIKGAENKEVKLIYYLADNQYIKQQKQFDKKGKVVFSGKEDLPTGIYKIAVGQNNYFDLLIRNEQKFSLSSDTSDFIGHMKVKGSKENELFFAYQKQVIALKTQLNNLNRQLHDNKDSTEQNRLNQKIAETEKTLDNLWKNTITNYPNSYLSKILKAYNTMNVNEFNFADPEMLRTPIYYTMLRLFIKQNINKKPEYIIYETKKLLDSLKNVQDNYRYVADYLLNFYNTYYKNGMNEVFVYISDHYFLPDKANWFSKEQLSKIQERRDVLGQSLPGNTAPDLTLESISGEYLSLHQTEAKFVLLYFWSANCGHCTKSSTILKQYYPKLQEKNIEIFAVNIDKDTNEWKKKVENMDLEWINCHDENEVSNFREKFYVYATPLLYLINSKHKILSIQNGEIEIERLVKRLAE
ncbi:MAG: AhpC/TSA family protein [Bacteroidales bacterium]|nr:AhpC/TSA family protein [Bacteroidales bacterium]